MASREQGLSERKKLILKAIVEAHIQDGEPVGSKSLMESRLQKILLKRLKKNSKKNQPTKNLQLFLLEMTMAQQFIAI